ncbi:hypothetical protein [Abyssisolibacter fermentans]|uniref:hypothetical protein n=1 Tax=Abyssisolibacter fermentans TaxID=1766203 RepID=UPI00082A6910|nr:hypothetical protein [Abyssisolibacter fermentans]
MKKVCAIILMMLLVISSFSVYASSPDSFLRPLNSSLKSEDIYIGIPYDENSTAGYEIKTDSNGNKYKQRIRHIKRTSTDLTLVQSEFLLSLYPGQTKTVTETHTDTRSTSVQWSTTTSTSASFKAVNSSVNTSVSTTLATNNASSSSYSISKGTSYAFPVGAPADARYCNIYSGFCHDIYEVVIDYVPYKTYDKKTKVTDIIVTSPAVPDGLSYEFDISVWLADGRFLQYHTFCAPHHYNDDYYKIPEVMRELLPFEDGYYHEITSGYDFSSREEFYGTIKKPIPYERHVYIY